MDFTSHTIDYRKRRFLVWFPLGLTYATLYMGRYNLNVASKAMMDMFNLSKEQFGLIGTAGFWTYALSVIINGPLSDRIGGKKAILIGACGAAVINLLIGILFLNGWQTKLIVGMSLLYSLNCYFQSFGAVSIVKINAAWFHVRERGVFGGIFGIMISSGYFLAMTVGGWIMANMSWYFVFLIPSVCMAAMAAIDYFLVSNSPSQAGFLDFNTGDASSNDADKHKPVDMSFVINRILRNKVIMTLAISEFCTGFVRQGLMFWFVAFLAERHAVHHGSAMFTVATLGVTLGGIIGGIICGYMSDKMFGSRRPPVAFIFYLAQVAALLGLGYASSPLAASIMVGVCCVWIFGVHGMLSGAAS
ncbi:MAG TPA: MFS transporter, partial [Elusimicrobiales bacterium]|nr:MFS transporter [Elusimicrobiales bacterium]